MSKIEKVPYEISIWNDVPYYQKIGSDGVAVDFKETKLEDVSTKTSTSDSAIPITDSTTGKVTSKDLGYTTFGEIPLSLMGTPSAEKTIKFFKEEKVAIIGSDQMTSPIRAFDPCLKRNTNGSITLTFDMFYQYYDEESGEYLDNPYTGVGATANDVFLTNERKIKLHYKNEWYDLLVKEIAEDSENHIVTYTCESLPINELSRAGYSIELSTDLNNSIGTVTELAETILDGSDWKVDYDNTDILEQRVEEPLYTIITNVAFTAARIDKEKLEDGSYTSVSKTIPKGATIYGFYSSVSSIIAGSSSELQFIYSERETPYTVDRVIQDGQKYSQYNTYQYTIGNIGYDGGTLLITDSAAAVANADAENADALNANDLYISNEYRGERVVRNSTTMYDPVLGKVVTVYRDNNTGEIYYGYTVSQYATSETIKSFITNGSDFPNEEGWEPCSSDATVEVVNYSPSGSYSFDDFHSLLRMKTFSKNALILNTGIDDNASDINGFSKGEEFVFRISHGQAKVNKTTYRPDKDADFLRGTDCKFFVRDYKVVDDKYIFGQTFFSTPSSGFIEDPGSIYTEIAYTLMESSRTYYVKTDSGDYAVFSGAISPKETYYQRTRLIPYKSVRSKCKMSITYSEMLSGLRNTSKWSSCSAKDTYLGYGTSGWHIGLFIKFEHDPQPGDLIYEFLEDIQFFRYVPDGNDAMLLPGVAPTVTDSKSYCYYQLTGDEEDADDVVVETLASPKTDLTPCTRTTLRGEYEKTKTLEGEKSNRYNLIQSLCETFECWAEFKIGRNEETGEILLVSDYDKDGNFVGYRQDKKIAFKEYIGKDNDAGFKYGINLVSIKRETDSTEIVTKMIVAQNSNEYADGGMCTIQAADSNPSGESYILNFDYYINQGMLQYSEVMNDLYGSLGSATSELNYGDTDINDTVGWLAFYTRLKSYNQSYQDASSQQAQILTAKTQIESQYTIYDSGKQAALEGISDAIETMRIDTSLDGSHPLSDVLQATIDRSDDDTVAFDAYNKYIAYNQQLNQYSLRLTALDKELTTINEKLTELKAKKTAILFDKAELESRFYKKYSRFIQEGTWSSEDYIDPELYYLDAANVMTTSAFPKVTYQLSVLEISQLDGYDIYSYDIGDKSFIEDTDFFGYYTADDGLRTPYHEEVIVSETTDYLDEPDKNTITIQNYKTQFQDLFQRIAAATQSITESKGTYDRVSNLVNEDGTLKIEVLQETVNNNALNLSFATNESVKVGEDGITTVDLNNPNKILRMSSGIIAMSRDGGSSWTTGMTADGINASLITAGHLDASAVTIGSGKYPTFKWDQYGLNAYKFNERGNSISVDYGQFVRYDQYGIYGISNSSLSDTWHATSLQDVKDTANFGLIWGQFFMRSDDNKGYTSISSTDEIQVFAVGNYQPVTLKRDSLGNVIKEVTDTYYYEEGGKYYVSDDCPEYRYHLAAARADETGIVENFQNGITYYVYNDEGYEATTDEAPLYGKTYYTKQVTKNEEGDELEYTYVVFTDSAFEEGVTYYERVWYIPTTDTEPQVGTTYYTYDKVQYYTGEYQERIKIGLLDNEDLYGIRLRNGNGEDTLVSGSDGNIWLKNVLTVGDGATSTVKIGYNTSDADEDVHLNDNFDGGRAHEVIHAGQDGTKNEFVVYEDGYMSAAGAKVQGGIYADYGRIGNVTIEDVSQVCQDMTRIDIESTTSNYQFKTTEEGSGPESITFRVVPQGFDIGDATSIVWYESTDFEVWEQLAAGAMEYELTYNHFSAKMSGVTSENYYLKVKYTRVVNETSIDMVDTCVVNEIRDGTSPYLVQITSSTGNLYINGDISAYLTAHVYKGNEEITTALSADKFVWSKYDKDGNKDEDFVGIGNPLVINGDDVFKKAMFNCEITIQERKGGNKWL